PYSCSSPPPPPPPSPLFPYTTLFRSFGRPTSSRGFAKRTTRTIITKSYRRHLGEPGHHEFFDNQPLTKGQPSHGPLTFGERLVVDRKSTRLNSSHVKSSYAVFCLKKK